MNYYPHQATDFTPGVKVSRLPVVYVLSTADMAFIKIGRTVSIKQRLINIQSGCPFDLSLWLTIRTPKPAEVERAAQCLLAHCCTRGEWFEPEGKDLDLISAFFQATNLNVREAARALL
ncbi:T5orf172 domain [Bordetella trematum]|uniref:GIY-YIG nuclease family protein n=1 Tax=Bordetella trematum TaxID=123899 RepID=UPI0007952BC5|nr:GIY-YIG nuclease family protein [Bordetella trematum]SAI62920.1 T5orf172 domain [Bordetella trematum]